MVSGNKSRQNQHLPQPQLFFVFKKAAVCEENKLLKDLCPVQISPFVRTWLVLRVRALSEGVTAQCSLLRSAARACLHFLICAAAVYSTFRIRKASCSSVFDFLIPHPLRPKRNDPSYGRNRGTVSSEHGSAHISEGDATACFPGVAPADGFSDLAMQVMTSRPRTTSCL